MRPDPAALARATLAGERAGLGRAITLLESDALAHTEDALTLLHLLTPPAQPAVRIGVTGVPGVGKSTLIEALGLHLIGLGHRVAVLAIDPSSPRFGGSILGDKTRMPRLARDARAFIRPSASGGALGGVHRKTRHTIQAVEAAGYDVVLVETVGVGQSEVSVADMVDVFLVLLLPNAGDDLQGIKKGLIEVADQLAVGKADLDAAAAQRTARDYAAALRLIRHDAAPVLRYSALTGEGVPELWAAVRERWLGQVQSGALEARRREQAVHWFKALVQEGVLERFYLAPGVTERLADAERRVAHGAASPLAAALAVLSPDALTPPPPHA